MASRSFLAWSRSSLMMMVTAVVGGVLGMASSAQGGGCPCNADVAPPFNGIVELSDISAVVSCLQGTCNCTPSCDVNCDGRVDNADVQAATCRFQGVPAEACCPAVGACCIDGTACSIATQAQCEDAPPNGAGGCYIGDGTACPTQNAAIFPEGGGTVFVHVIGPPIDCTPLCGGGVASAPSRSGCTGNGPYFDPWVSPVDGQMCHDFGSIDTDPIPADFFGPGSDPFTGTVCLEGAPLGGPYGDADTVIERSDDPFTRCTAPSAAQNTVNIEIIALSLVSVAPITVTYNGGMNPEQWDVAVDLSPSGLVAGTPQGTLTATKTHCNGGTYTADLYVQPRFTFTGPGGTKVLDTFDQNTPAVHLDQTEARPWVVDADPMLGLQSDPCTFFHPNIEEADPQPGSVCDQAADGVMDICQVPATSEWGLLVLVLLTLASGTVVLRRGSLTA